MPPDRRDVLYGSLELKTLEALGPLQHATGIVDRFFTIREEA